MKQILFTRDEYLNVICLKRTYTSFSINLYLLHIESVDESIKDFYFEHEERVNKFLIIYDTLCKNINSYDKNLTYFNDRDTKLGLLCLRHLDEIGKNIDLFIEQKKLSSELGRFIDDKWFF